MPIDKKDFIHVASTRDGSRDIGAQLFCALLRAAGVTTRLVCSLQVLPFTSVTTRASASQFSKPVVFEDGNKHSGHDEAASSGTDQTKDGYQPAWNLMSNVKRDDTPEPLVLKRARRLGQPSFGIGPDGADIGRAPIVQGIWLTLWHTGYYTQTSC